VSDLVTIKIHVLRIYCAREVSGITFIKLKQISKLESKIM